MTVTVGAVYDLKGPWRQVVVATVTVGGACGWCRFPGQGRRREFHPPAPTDPGVTVSCHRALVTLVTRRS